MNTFSTGLTTTDKKFLIFYSQDQFTKMKILKHFKKIWV